MQKHLRDNPKKSYKQKVNPICRKKWTMHSDTIQGGLWERTALLEGVGGIANGGGGAIGWCGGGTGPAGIAKPGPWGPEKPLEVAPSTAAGAFGGAFGGVFGWAAAKGDKGCSSASSTWRPELFEAKLAVPTLFSDTFGYLWGSIVFIAIIWQQSYLRLLLLELNLPDFTCNYLGSNYLRSLVITWVQFTWVRM